MEQIKVIRDKYDSIKCLNGIIDSYVDMEFSGLSDLFLTATGSIFNRLSRVLIMKRNKILCVNKNGHSLYKHNTNLNHYDLKCKDFKTNKLHETENQFISDPSQLENCRIPTYVSGE